MFEAIEIGPFIIWTHVVFVLLGTWLATEFFLRLAQSAHLSLQDFRARSLWYLGAFILMGRLTAIVTEYRAYLRDIPRMFVVWDGGFSFLGASIGIGCVLYSHTKHSRATFLQWLDVLLPATTFGLFFEWLGKFTAGQSYGKPTDMFWGVTYDAINVRYVVPIHPVQLYYAFFFLILTFLLLIVRKHTVRAGAETLFGIILASCATMFLEFFRGDFGIPVFATQLDFLLLFLLFISLGVFATVELALTQHAMVIYELCLTVILVGYFLLRTFLPFDAYELRFSQLLGVLALLATIVYVMVHRRRYPHL